MDDEVTYICDACREEIVIPIDLSQGLSQEWQATIARSHDSRIPMPGTVLSRKYKGKTIQVTVLPGGFDYEGAVYRSLSAAAKAITGSHNRSFSQCSATRLACAKTCSAVSGRKTRRLLQLGSAPS